MIEANGALKDGIRFVRSAEPVAEQGRSGKGVSLTVRMPAGTQTIEASDILVATGRIPNTAGIGLEAAGVGIGTIR
jgi:pyruvate/2-oxoglutarate dehydrogenase complex dihydrolipoamide dehydrogenase (E3) component